MCALPNVTVFTLAPVNAAVEIQKKYAQGFVCWHKQQALCVHSSLRRMRRVCVSVCQCLSVCVCVCTENVMCKRITASWESECRSQLAVCKSQNEPAPLITRFWTHTESCRSINLFPRDSIPKIGVANFFRFPYFRIQKKSQNSRARHGVAAFDYCGI